MNNVMDYLLKIGFETVYSDRGNIILKKEDIKMIFENINRINGVLIYQYKGQTIAQFNKNADIIGKLKLIFEGTSGKAKISKIGTFEAMQLAEKEKEKGINLRYVTNFYKNYNKDKVYVLLDDHIIYVIELGINKPNIKELSDEIISHLELFKEIHNTLLDYGFEYKKGKDARYYEYKNRITIETSFNNLYVSLSYTDIQKVPFKVSNNTIKDIEQYFLKLLGRD